MLGFVFPALAIRDLSMSLAGTDNVRSQQFAEAAESHRRDLVRALNKDLEVNGAELGFMYQAGPELWKRIPRFEFPSPLIEQTLYDQRLALTSLLAWLVGATVLVFISARSLRVD